MELAVVGHEWQSTGPREYLCTRCRTHLRIDSAATIEETAVHLPPCEGDVLSAPPKRDAAEAQRRKTICLACDQWTTQEPAGCSVMKPCDRQWGILQHQWDRPTGTCARKSRLGLPDKWAKEPEDQEPCGNSAST